jgi:Kef-type K+ transport system membrane component KefB
LAVIYVIFTLFVMPFLMKLLYKGLHDIRTTEAVGITILVAGCFSILAYVMGLHIMIGAFLGGMAAGSALKHSTKMALNRWSFGFFAPLFFAYIGYSVTFSGAVFSLFVPLIMVMGMVGKVLGAGLGAKISGLNWAESFLVGVGMNGRAAVDLILASVALSSGIIERDLFSAIVLNAAVMALITPVLLKMLVSFFKRNGRIAA